VSQDRTGATSETVRQKLGRIYRGETNVDFIGRRKLWFSLSTVVLLACLASLFIKGLNFGIEFEGGVQVQAPVEDQRLVQAEPTDVIAIVRDAITGLGAEDAQIQVTEGETRSILVQTKRVTTGAARNRLIEAVAESVGADPAETDSASIGSKWGAEITNKAVRALVIFLVVVVAFMSWRFDWKMAVGAMAALVHDLLITAGVYSMVGFEVTPSTVIAILTILGYSLYDTVVVFDKVEEDTTMYATTGKMTYQDAANLAMNQVFMRSLNTSLSTLLPVAALLFVGAGLLGAGTLEDLALALFVGILSGTYSSIFVATPILAMLKEREPRYRNVRDKVLRDARRAGNRPAGIPSREPVAIGAVAASRADVGVGESAAPADAAVSEAPATAPKQPSPTSKSSAPRRSTGSKKAKRRKRR
jgi:preprotein translocase subunit SecF